MNEEKDRFLDDFKKYVAFNSPAVEITDIGITKESFVPEIATHLEENSILMLGSADEISEIENYAFKPDTPDNGDLEMIIIHEPYINAIFFAKKTLLFTTYLQDTYGLTTAEISNLQMMWFIKGEVRFGSDWTTEQIYDIMDMWLKATS